MPVRTFNSNEIAKLKQLMNEGIQVTGEVEALEDAIAAPRPQSLPRNVTRSPRRDRGAPKKKNVFVRPLGGIQLEKPTAGDAPCRNRYGKARRKK